MDKKNVEINGKTISKEYIKEIHIAYCFARDIKHYINIEGYEKTEFYPSKFMYTYMCFNMIYDLFKKESINRTSRKVFRNSVVERIEKFLDFLTDKEFDISEKIDVVDLKSLLSKINVNENNEDQVSYLPEFKKNIIKAEKEKISKEELKSLLIYIDSIRNNLFHGSKKASKFIKDGQGQRLKIYTNILLKVCDLFFDSLKGIDLSKGFEIADNMEAWKEVK